MELLDLRFSEKTLKILKGMAGQVFEKYRCDPSISILYIFCLSVFMPAENAI